MSDKNHVYSLLGRKTVPIVFLPRVKLLTKIRNENSIKHYRYLNDSYTMISHKSALALAIGALSSPPSY